VSALLDSLVESFEALPGDRRDALGLGPARREALRQGLSQGLPTQRSEAWKYTSLRALGARRFAAHAGGATRPEPGLLDAIPSPRLVFVNGRLDARASTSGTGGEPWFRALSDVLAGADVGVAADLARSHGRPDEVFAAFNEALAVEGAVVEVAAGVDAGTLHLAFVSTPADADLALHLRHVVRLQPGARLRLVEHHLAAGPHRHFGNHLVHIELGAGAILDHVRLQDEDEGASVVARTEAVLEADACYRRVDLELGAGLSRHDLSVRLAGERAQCDAGGVLLADARRHLDTRLSVTHAARDTRCDLRWRGLAADRARVAFLGGIRIRPGADGSDASLSAKNLLLSEGAEVNAQPVLEIHADEVKAAHGATVGRLDETALFYLRSRGIPAPLARDLLTQAFCREALRAIDDAALSSWLGERLEAHLAAGEPA
jgi:Fe-S cluster assembly protein SufD